MVCVIAAQPDSGYLWEKIGSVVSLEPPSGILLSALASIAWLFHMDKFSVAVLSF